MTLGPEDFRALADEVNARCTNKQTVLITYVDYLGTIVRPGEREVSVVGSRGK